ncbi:xanthine dehydrogenase family protein molybdopterin-binding subunit [Chloroflexota bacterium]
MANEYSVVGKSLPQIDVFEKVTGKLQYGSDIVIAGMLHAKVLRSPYAHAKVVKIDTSKAEALPGVATVITYKDCNEKDWICPAFNWQGPVISQTVRHVGDEVAAVAAVDEATAEEALDLIDVEYKPLPAVFNMLEAMKPDAVQVRPDGNMRRPNIFEWGDLEKGLKESDFVVELETHLGQQQHAPLDRNACIASWTKDKVTLWTGSQCVFWWQTAVAAYFDLPLNKARIISNPIGGTFGFWWQNNYMFVAMILSKKCGKPVRLELSREEVFSAVKRRELPISYIKVGAKNNGELTAFDIKHLFDNGAYGNKFDPYQTVADMYRVDNGRYEAIGVSTNLLTAGCMRGVGDFSLGYAVEVAFDMVAEKLGTDPVEFRLKNHFRTGDVLPTSQEYMFQKFMFNRDIPVTLSSSGLSECIKSGAEAIGWKGKWKGWGKPVAVDGVKKRGIGLAIATHISGLAFFGFNGAMVRVNSDGSVNFVTGVGRFGQGADTTQAQVVAEVLGISLDDIMVNAGDTDVCPPAMASVGSTSMHMVSRATQRAAENAKRQILELAGKRLEAAPEDLDIKDRKIFVKKELGKSIGLKELLSQPLQEHLCAPTIVGSSSEGFPYDKGGKMMMAHFADVEVDTETGKVTVLKYVAVHDSGILVNPAICENQVYGGVYAGVGLGLTENLQFDKDTGMILNPNFIDYKVIKALDMPDPEVIFEEVYDDAGAFGAKGIGEGTTCSCCPALANAVYNAIGFRIDPPMHPEQVLRALGKL